VPAQDWGPLLGYGLLTAAAFTLTFAALARLGARHASVLMTLEALCTVALAAVLLGEAPSAGQALGGACVLAATVLVARTRAPAAAEALVGDVRVVTGLGEQHHRADHDQHGDERQDGQHELRRGHHENCASSS
jgi:EamA-like transporter family protein